MIEVLIAITIFVVAIFLGYHIGAVRTIKVVCHIADKEPSKLFSPAVLEIIHDIQKHPEKYVYNTFGACTLDSVDKTFRIWCSNTIMDTAFYDSDGEHMRLNDKMTYYDMKALRVLAKRVRDYHNKTILKVLREV
jgi:hypothetical protein